MKALLIGLFLVFACCRHPAHSSSGQLVVMEVKENLADCVGVGPMKCMMVRYDISQPWYYFYQGIEGFDYEPGYRYRLEVQVSHVENPPADGSSRRYRLVRVIEKQIVTKLEVMEVKEHLIDCVGVALMKCMMVRSDNNKPWEYFYQGIEGFEYEPGYRYRLEVQVSHVQNPPADGSSLHYRLVRVLEKTPVAKLEVIEVKEHLADCFGVAPMKCMLVRQNGSQQWTLFYQGVEGFQYEPGYRYRLEVQVSNVENPPADASSLRYSLVRILEKRIAV